VPQRTAGGLKTAGLGKIFGSPAALTKEDGSRDKLRGTLDFQSAEEKDFPL